MLAKAVSATLATVITALLNVSLFFHNKTNPATSKATAVTTKPIGLARITALRRKIDAARVFVEAIEASCPPLIRTCATANNLEAVVVAITTALYAKKAAVATPKPIPNEIIRS